MIIIISEIRLLLTPFVLGPYLADQVHDIHQKDII